MSTDYRQAREHINALGRKFGAELPSVAGAFGQLHKTALGPGALDQKTKELMALGIAITSKCEGCIAYHLHDALKAGATPKEVVETIGVAVMMGGGPAMIYGGKALEALHQLSAEG